MFTVLAAEKQFKTATGESRKTEAVGKAWPRYAAIKTKADPEQSR